MVVLGLLQAISLPMDLLILSVLPVIDLHYSDSPVFNNDMTSPGMAWRAYSSLVPMHGCK